MSNNEKQLISCRVTSVRSIAANTCRMVLHAESLSQRLLPGQFVNIDVPHCGEILWRRPFSIHEVDRTNGTFAILFNIVGRGSKALSRIQAGGQVDCLGPLGNSFVIPRDIDELLIVAGGLGIAPFYFLLQELQQTALQKSLFYGVGTADQFCRLQEFADLGAKLILTTDDGSEGEKGTIIIPLERYLDKAEPKKRFMVTCGPTKMMQEVQNLAQKHGISGSVSVENLMACGFGACMGCPVRLKNPQSLQEPYVLACKEGPVFSIQEIDIDE